MKISVSAIGKGDETFKFDPDNRNEVANIIQMISDRLNQGFIVYGKIRGTKEEIQIQFTSDAERRLREIEEFSITKKYVNKTILQTPQGG